MFLNIIKLKTTTTVLAVWEDEGKYRTRRRRVTHLTDDFFFFLENHILEDVNKCVIALQEKDVDGLDRTAGAIRGRAARVVHVVTSEMDNYEPGVYTEKVLEATKLLSDTGIIKYFSCKNKNQILTSKMLQLCLFFHDCFC